MAVISTREIWKGSNGEFNYTFTPSDTLTRTYIVRTNSTSDSIATVMTAGTLPAMGSSHPNSNILTVRKISVEREAASPFLYNVSVEYGDAPLKPPIDPNPLTRPAVVTAEGQQYSRSSTRDYQGVLEKNTAGDPFDPHDVDDVRFSWSIEKNVPYNAVPSWTITYPNSVNSDSFTIAQLGLTFDAYTLKMSGMKMSDIKSEYVDNVGLVRYRTIGFALAFNPLTWKYKPANRGFRAIKNGMETDVTNTLGVGSIYRIVTSSQKGPPTYLSIPAYLAEDGSRIEDPVSEDEIVFLEFDDYGPLDFSVLTPYCV